MIFRVRQWLPSRRWEWILRVITRPNDRQSRVSTTSGIYTTYSPTLLLLVPSVSRSFLYTYVSRSTTCPDTQVCRNRTDTFTWICAFEFESAHQRQGGRADATRRLQSAIAGKRCLSGTLANWRMNFVPRGRMGRLMSRKVSRCLPSSRSVTPCSVVHTVCTFRKGKGILE